MLHGEWRVARSPEGQFRHEGLAEVSAMLGPGVYVLWRGHRVVKIAWTKAVLERVAAHRNLAGQKSYSWMPIKGIQFDRVAFWPCAEDRINEVMGKVRAEIKGESAAAA
jgi:hypothetical protein